MKKLFVSSLLCMLGWVASEGAVFTTPSGVSNVVYYYLTNRVVAGTNTVIDIVTSNQTIRISVTGSVTATNLPAGIITNFYDTPTFTNGMYVKNMGGYPYLYFAGSQGGNHTNTITSRSNIFLFSTGGRFSGALDVPYGILKTAKTNTLAVWDSSSLLDSIAVTPTEALNLGGSVENIQSSLNDKLTNIVGLYGLSTAKSNRMGYVWPDKLVTYYTTNTSTTFSNWTLASWPVDILTMSSEIYDVYILAPTDGAGSGYARKITFGVTVDEGIPSVTVLSDTAHNSIGGARVYIVSDEYIYITQTNTVNLNYHFKTVVTRYRQTF